MKIVESKFRITLGQSVACNNWFFFWERGTLAESQIDLRSVVHIGANGNTVSCNSDVFIMGVGDGQHIQQSVRLRAAVTVQDNLRIALE